MHTGMLIIHQNTNVLNGGGKHHISICQKENFNRHFAKEVKEQETHTYVNNLTAGCLLQTTVATISI